MYIVYVSPARSFHFCPLNADGDLRRDLAF